MYLRSCNQRPSCETGACQGSTITTSNNTTPTTLIHMLCALSSASVTVSHQKENPSVSIDDTRMIWAAKTRRLYKGNPEYHTDQ